MRASDYQASIPVYLSAPDDAMLATSYAIRACMDRTLREVCREAGLLRVPAARLTFNGREFVLPAMDFGSEP